MSVLSVRSVVSSLRKEEEDGRQMISIHGGTEFNVKEMEPRCWCFYACVGQAVTNPGCKTVVDFMEEMKLETVLHCSGDGLICNHSLKRIGWATLKQKGRAGQINSGQYAIRVDHRTAIAILRLEADPGLVQGSYIRHM